MALLFADAAGVAKVVVTVLFLLVWVIAAIVKSANEQKEKTRPPLPRPDSAPRPNAQPRPAAMAAQPRQASAAERAEFLRKAQQPPPRKATPVAAKPISAKPIPATPVRAAIPVAAELPRRLHSELEDRHTVDLHSRLEQQHLHTQTVRGPEMSQRPAGVNMPIDVRANAQRSLLTAMLSDRRNLAMALMLGQALRPPALASGAPPGASDPLGLPPLPR